MLDDAKEITVVEKRKAFANLLQSKIESVYFTLNKEDAIFVPKLKDIFKVKLKEIVNLKCFICFLYLYLHIY